MCVLSEGSEDSEMKELTSTPCYAGVRAELRLRQLIGILFTDTIHGLSVEGFPCCFEGIRRWFFLVLFGAMGARCNASIGHFDTGDLSRAVRSGERKRF